MRSHEPGCTNSSHAKTGKDRLPLVLLRVEPALRAVYAFGPPVPGQLRRIR